jgi:hypothetical protein
MLERFRFKTACQSMANATACGWLFCNRTRGLAPHAHGLLGSMGCHPQCLWAGACHPYDKSVVACTLQRTHCARCGACTCMPHRLSMKLWVFCVVNGGYGRSTSSTGADDSSTMKVGQGWPPMHPMRNALGVALVQATFAEHTRGNAAWHDPLEFGGGLLRAHVRLRLLCMTGEQTAVAYLNLWQQCCVVRMAGITGIPPTCLIASTLCTTCRADCTSRGHACGVLCCP